ncbi:LOW QUALITY PROTEIN: ataxin-7 [Macrotis lagotis]|uniref:LOW QUALITY PROTEIN: ataxin-7 n=1 Tax=Macrotis lagotis TaxID=92651 RepID=UPI003D680975
MSERAADDVRGEPRRAAAAAAAAGGAAAAAARQPQPPQPPQPPRPPRPPPAQQQQQRPPPRARPGESSASAATMATVGERGSLPSPEAMAGQPWSHWLDAAKLPGKDGAEPEESWKEFGKNREVMRLCREDMPIFGLCPAHDDFYLVICNHCNQVVKPQAFQSHYERRHSSSNKPPLTTPPSSMYSFFPSLSKSKGNNGSAGGNSRSCGGGILSTPSSNSKLLKSPKDKPQLSGNSRPMHPAQPGRAPHDKVLTPSIKLEKIHPKMDGALLKTALGPAGSATVSSSIKTGLNCPSIPKPPLPSPGQILNGQGLLPAPPVLEKKSEDHSNNRKFLHKRLSEREFDPDIYCGVIDVETKKPCTRSLTCKTHSLTQRRAVQGRRKRFDVLLAEHKNKSRDKELLRHPDQPLTQQQPQIPPLREPHASPSKSSPELHPNSHGVIPAESKPLVSNKPRPHNPSLPRPPGFAAPPGGTTPSDPPASQAPHPPLPLPEPAPRGSSDEGEGDEKEEPAERLDGHYSARHPQPASFCTFGSRQVARGYFVFDQRWNHLRCALSVMLDKHLAAQMWRRLPPAPGHSAPPARVPPRAGPGPSPPACASSASPAPAPGPPASSRPAPAPGAPAHGTALQAPPAPGPRPAAAASSPCPASALPAAPAPGAPRCQKLKSGKAAKPREAAAPGAPCHSAGKKRKTSAPPCAPPLLLRLLSSASSSSSSSSPHSTDSFRKNCVVNSASCGPGYPSPVPPAPGLGLNCLTSRANSVGPRHEASGRGAPTGSPSESIKRMSVMVNSGDSTLSLGPFVHQPPELMMTAGGFPHSHPHPPLDKLLGKKRKGSPGAGAPHHGSQAGKVAKLPSMNSVHTKHPGPIPGTPGLAGSALLHQSGSQISIPHLSGGPFVGVNPDSIPWAPAPSLSASFLHESPRSADSGLVIHCGLYDLEPPPSPGIQLLTLQPESEEEIDVHAGESSLLPFSQNQRHGPDSWNPSQREKRTGQFSLQVRPPPGPLDSTMPLSLRPQV